MLYCSRMSQSGPEIWSKRTPYAVSNRGPSETLGAVNCPGSSVPGPPRIRKLDPENDPELDPPDGIGRGPAGLPEAPSKPGGDAAFGERAAHASKATKP